MLRYFYLIICIQMCFCSIYVDNNVDYESVSPQVRSTRGLRKVTRSVRSRVVQFDVDNFLQGSEEAVDDYRYYGYRDKKRHNRYTSSNEAGYVEPHESNERSQPADLSSDDRPQAARFNPRAQNKFVNPRHFNHPEQRVSRRDQKKSTTSYKHSQGTEKRNAHSERKCSFRNMRIPFFSRNKATAKAKRHKKRKIFCFNCKKTTVAARPNTISRPEAKPNDCTKDSQNPSSTFSKTNSGVNKIKRAYGPLCPKCIKELLVNLKKKTTTKKHKHATTPKVSKMTKRATKQKPDLEDNKLEENTNEGVDDVGSERMKRNEEEDQERERRLKELEEVEKKIAKVNIVNADFRKNGLSNK